MPVVLPQPSHPGAEALQRIAASQNVLHWFFSVVGDKMLAPGTKARRDLDHLMHSNTVLHTYQQLVSSAHLQRAPISCSQLWRTMGGRQS